MEPMALGSNPSTPGSPIPNSNFLPLYLVGDKQPATMNTNLISPFQSPMLNLNMSTDGRNLRKKLFTPNSNDIGAVPNIVVASPQLVEKRGPPRQGLFDTIEQGRISKNFDGPNDTTFNDSLMKSSNVELEASQTNLSYNYGMSSNPFHSTLDNNDSSLWVTIFGFPSNMTSAVLAHFASFSTIAEEKFPAQGNWVHVKFTSYYEVTKALSFNGKLILNTIMIGVVPYVNKSENKENVNNSVYLSPIRARPLRQSAIESPNARATRNIQPKPTSFVSKAIEMVFGW